MELGKKIKLAALLKRLGGNADNAILDSITREIKTIKDFFNAPPQIVEKTIIVEGKPGLPGEPGRDAKPLDPKPIIEEVKRELLPFIPQGGGAPNRQISINSSVIGKPYTDMNYIGSIAAISNNTTKQTDIIFSGGGGTPAAPDTSVQFNDGGSFGGDAAFIWDGSGVGLPYIFAPSSVNPSQPYLDFTGGFEAGFNNAASVQSPGSAVSFTAQNGYTNTDGGGVIFLGGSGGATSGSGGSVSLTAGSAQGGDSNGGNVVIETGTKSGAGTPGQFYMSALQAGAYIHFQSNPSSDVGAIIDTNALTSDRTFTFPDQSGTFVITNGHARATGQTAANTNVLTQAVGAADATFTVHANVLVTTSTAHSFGVTVDYTDESNTARTLTIPFSQLAGTLIAAITDVTGAGPYEGVVLTIRAKASTNIVFKTAGTFTTVTYNVDASVVQIA